MEICSKCHRVMVYGMNCCTGKRLTNVAPPDPQPWSAMPDQPLPDPKDVQALMTVMSARLVEIVEKLVGMAAVYGIHGEPTDVGGFSFQVTRHSEKWGVFVSPMDNTAPKNIFGARLNQKIIFLDHADEFTKQYNDLITSVYEALKRVTSKKP